jgi:hypothetical protein
VIAAAEQARAADADLIVTVGGGSITDGAKAVQLCLANNIRTVEAIDAVRSIKGAAPDMTAPTVRQISVPTTIAGGEFSALAGVTNLRTKVKEMLRHERVMPRAVILDPAVTVHTPLWLWLSTGIRAVDHCVEGLCSREAHPYADAQALKGLSMLTEALPRVKADSRDLDARMDCQIGTWLSMGPLSSGVPMGASHGIGYVLGAAFGGDGPARQGCRRRARWLHSWPRDAAQPAGRAHRPRAFRSHRRAGDGDAVDTAQPAQDRPAGAGTRDSSVGRLGSLETRCTPASMLISARCSPLSSWRARARP